MVLILQHLGWSDKLKQPKCVPQSDYGDSNEKQKITNRSTVLEDQIISIQFNTT